jgi:hypothetical protein
MTHPVFTASVDRRTLFKAGLAASTLAAAGSLFDASPASAATPPLPASHRFKLSAHSPSLFTKKVLDESHHSMQGFAFDNVNHRLFVVQSRNGMSTDNLSINHVSMSGHVYSTMHLGHAGHGVSIGVEAVGSSSYIWMECDAHGTGDKARGTALARFKYVGNKSPSHITKHFVGSTAITCATDPFHNRIAVRRQIGGHWRFGVYELHNGKIGTRLVQAHQPALKVNGVTQVNQGWTLYGQYIYMLTGTGNAKSNSNPDKYINSRIWCLDLNTGTAAAVSDAHIPAARIKEHFLTQAGKSLVYREPEGMAVYRPPGHSAGLYFGYSARPSMGSATRYANIFHKDGWA